MNKIVLVAVFAILGAALYFLAVTYYPPFTTFMTSMPTDLTQLSDWFQNNLTAIIPTAAGVGTVTTLLYNQVYKRAKQAQEQLATEKVSEVQNELLARANELSSVKTLNTQLQSQIQTLEGAQTQIETLTAKVEKKQAEADAANERANEAERLFREKYFPEPETPRVP